MRELVFALQGKNFTVEPKGEVVDNHFVRLFIP
jgi:hypothetical protein